MDNQNRASGRDAERDVSEKETGFGHSIANGTEYETVFNAIEDPVFLFAVDRDGGDVTFRFQRSNPAHETSTGIATEECRGQTPCEILGEEAGSELVTHYRNCVEKQDTVAYEERTEYPAGTLEWLTKLTPVIEDGVVEQIVGLARDITEHEDRKRTVEKRTAHLKQRELDRSKERLRGLFDEAPDGIVIHDADGNVLDVNNTLAEMLGYPPDELRSMEVPEFEIGVDEEELRERWTSMDPGAMQKIEVDGTHQRSDGSTYPVEVWVSKTANDEPGEDRLIALARDITERKERQRELERHKRFIENTNDVVTIIDPDGAIEFVSPAVERVLGWEPEELVAEDSLAYVHPDDRDDLAADIEALVERPDQEPILEFRFQCSGGGYCWIEATARNLLDAPDVEGILLSSRDITERKGYEQELAAERDFLDTIIESLPYPFYVLDVDDYSVEHANSKAATGPCETCYEATHGRDRPCDEGDDPIACPISDVTETDEPTTVEHVHYDEDGNERIYEVRAAPIFDDDGDVVRIAESNIDITERVEHQRRLSALHEATRQLINADSPEAVAEIAVEAASNLLGSALPSVWYPRDDGEIELVANAEEHQQLLAEAGTAEPTHHPDSWLWDVIGTDETVVRSSLPAEELAVDVPLQSAIVLPLGEHGVLACAARSEREFSDEELKLAETLAQNVRVTLEQIEQRGALERQQEFTDNLLDAIEDVVYVLDTDGTLKQWNTAFEKVTGYTSRELESMSLVDFFDDADVPAVEEALGEAFESGRVRVAFDFVTADGESIPYEFIASVFESPAGEPVLAGIGRDRSVHVEYERELERYKELVENVPVGIYRNTAGETGEFVELNPAMVEMFDAESETQLLDQPVRELYAEPSQRREFSQRLEDESVVTEVELELETLGRAVLGIGYSRRQGDRREDVLRRLDTGYHRAQGVRTTPRRATGQPRDTQPGRPSRHPQRPPACQGVRRTSRAPRRRRGERVPGDRSNECRERRGPHHDGT